MDWERDGDDRDRGIEIEMEMEIEIEVLVNKIKWMEYFLKNINLT